MKAIDDILQHENPVIKDLGLRAIKYKKQLEEKLLEPDEYTLLCNQLLDTQRIVIATEDANLRQQVGEAIEFLSKFLKIGLH